MLCALHCTCEIARPLKSVPKVHCMALHASKQGKFNNYCIVQIFLFVSLYCAMWWFQLCQSNLSIETQPLAWPSSSVKFLHSVRYIKCNSAVQRSFASSLCQPYPPFPPRGFHFVLSIAVNKSNFCPKLHDFFVVSVFANLGYSSLYKYTAFHLDNQIRKVQVMDWCI